MIPSSSFIAAFVGSRFSLYKLKKSRLDRAFLSSFLRLNLLGSGFCRVARLKRSRIGMWSSPVLQSSLVSHVDNVSVRLGVDNPRSIIVSAFLLRQVVVLGGRRRLRPTELTISISFPALLSTFAYSPP